MVGLLHQRKLLLFLLCLSVVIGVYLLSLGPVVTLSKSARGDLMTRTSAETLKEHVEKQQEKTIPPTAAVSSNKNKSSVKPVVVRQATKSSVESPKTDERPDSDFIGDKYTIDDVPPQTSCPNSIRQKVMKTDFAEKFLWTVPVLQWAKHFSQNEYRRLRRYSGAHGWGSVDVNDLKNTLALLNTSANRLMFADWEQKKSGSECIRCAVVGNGGILKGSKKGREIDEHDYVFRTNGVVFKGFEDDVGTRTSLYTFSFNTLRNSLQNYRDLGFMGAPQSEETKYIFLPDHDKDYKLVRSEISHTPFENSQKSPQYFGNNVTVEKFKMYHPDFIRYLRNRFLFSYILNTEYKNIYRPTTGAVMLLAALHTCDEVSAYGFITPNYYKYSDHYYDKVDSKLYFYANHDMRMELRLWQQLHKAGLLRLYMRT